MYNNNNYVKIKVLMHGDPFNTKNGKTLQTILAGQCDWQGNLIEDTAVNLTCSVDKANAMADGKTYSVLLSGWFVLAVQI